MSSRKTPQFFKIIIQDTIRGGRLGIPEKFVKYHGSCLSGRMIIRVPNGIEWVIELSKIANEVWLDKGWQEFSEYYSLKSGYLLVFKCEKKSQFTVLIFDTSLVEIEYPGSRNFSAEVQMKENETPLLSSQPNGSQPQAIVIEDSDCSIQELEGKPDKESRKCISGALQAANKFTSCNPWFSVVIKFTNVQSIPISFIREYMECETRTVTVKVEDRVWPLKLNFYAHKSTAVLSAGWGAFLRDNSLKLKDVCVFELIEKNVLNVHIFRQGSRNV